MLPAIDKDGKILMKSNCEMQLSPNGNGALLDSIMSNYLCTELAKTLSYLQVIGVDNVLNKLLDPVFIGWTAQRQLKASMKAVAKTRPEEKVGVMAMKNNRYNIVEYSEIP